MFEILFKAMCYVVAIVCIAFAVILQSKFFAIRMVSAAVLSIASGLIGGEADENG